MAQGVTPGMEEGRRCSQAWGLARPTQLLMGVSGKQGTHSYLHPPPVLSPENVLPL